MREIDDIRTKFEQTILSPTKKKKSISDKKVLRKYEKVIEKVITPIRLIAWIIWLSPFVILSENDNIPIFYKKYYLIALTIYLMIEIFVMVSIPEKKNRMTPQKFKEEIVNKLIKLFNSEWQYYPTRYVSEEAVEQSQLFLKDDYHVISGDDLIQGSMGTTHFACSEVSLLYGIENNESIFWGLFMVAEFNKSLKHQTIILPDIWCRIQNNQLEPVKLENSEFEEKFRVFSDDQVEVRYILTPTIMENIIRLYNKIQFPMAFSFNSNHMFMAIPISSIFEPTKVYATGDYSDIRKVYSIIEFIYMTIQEMNLNKRIWPV